MYARIMFVDTGANGRSNPLLAPRLYDTWMGLPIRQSVHQSGPADWRGRIAEAKLYRRVQD